MCNPCLAYAISANQDPIQASPAQGDPSMLKLIIVVSNTTGKTIDCQSISFGFLQGKYAEDLYSSADASGIHTAAPTGWSLEPDPDVGGLFNATPDTSTDGKIGGDSLTFVISNIQVNYQPGTTNMKITEVTDNGTGTLVYPLQKFPPQFEVGDLKSNPLSVDYGGSTTLIWSGTGDGATYQLQYQDGNGKDHTITETKDGHPLPSTGSYTVDNLTARPTIFNLVVTVQVTGQNESLTVQRQHIVAVGPQKAQINSFNIKPNPIVTGQQLSFTLSWDVVGSFQITANDGQGGTERVLPIPNNATSYLVFPSQLVTNYTLTVYPPSAQGAKKNHGTKES